jgi:hypothetical protein
MIVKFDKSARERLVSASRSISERAANACRRIIEREIIEIYWDSKMGAPSGVPLLCSCDFAADDCNHPFGQTVWHFIDPETNRYHAIPSRCACDVPGPTANCPSESCRWMFHFMTQHSGKISEIVNGPQSEPAKSAGDRLMLPPTSDGHLPANCRCMLNEIGDGPEFQLKSLLLPVIHGDFWRSRSAEPAEADVPLIIEAPAENGHVDAKPS